MTNIGIGIPSGSENNPSNNLPPNNLPPNNPPSNNPRGLDPNMLTIINALGNINLNLSSPSVIAQHKELNLVRPVKFARTEIENPNE